MRIYMTGMTGGIGSAIAEKLSGEDLTSVFNKEQGDFDWAIFAHGVMDEGNPEYMFKVNTLLCFSETEKLLKHVKQGLIFISSTAGIKGNTRYPIYSACKAALNSYAETLARLNPQLSIHALCPGPTDTRLWRSLGLEGEAQPPERVADVVADIVGGLHEGKVIITVRNGMVEYV